ncbi:helix-turn-helix transcriptional regulator [Muricoccus vinaceus]|uniref:Helix-turn-helix transcriptional regulator n=1 Tax=Muricoccus vinaceus TaxID=424704 RepID=A0ABV6ITE3_9PROT
MSVRSTPDYTEGDHRLRHLHQLELALRWNVSPRTLERWRWLGQGPRFLKLGGRVVYRIEDIEAFEAQQLRASRAAMGLG